MSWQIVALKKALDELKYEYSKTIGKEFTMAQLMNFKKKMSTHLTGNNPKKVNTWESEFLGILKFEVNPVFSKVPGVISAEVTVDNSSDASLLGIQNAPLQSDVASKMTRGLLLKKLDVEKQKHLVNNDGEESWKLTTLQLLSLVLAQELVATRLKEARTS